MRSAFALSLILLVLAAPAIAQDEFREPDPALTALVDAPMQPASTVSPDNRWLAAFEWNRVVPLAELAREELKLAGLRITPATFARSRSTGYNNFVLHDLETGERRAVEGLPEGAIHAPSWSSDSSHLAFTLERGDKRTLWIYEVASGQARELSDRPLNGVLSGPYTWLPDGEGLLINMAVNHGGELPQPSVETIAPQIQETDPERKAPVRTYQDLLETPLDAERFTFLATGQLARVNLDGEVAELGEPALFINFDSSPDTRYLLVESLQQPYSYSVPYYRFARRSQVWDAMGNTVTLVADLPSAEDIPKGFDSVQTGRRNIQWRADAPATLIWAEAQDGGDMSTEVDYHDHVFHWPAPFEETPEILARTERRFAGLDWADNGLAVLTEWRFADRKLRTWIVAPDDPEHEPVLFQERSYNDAYNDPGSPIRTLSEYGTSVIHTFDGEHILLAGSGASPEGNIPFLDRYDAASGESTRLWHSEAPYYERVVDVLDETGGRILTLREARDEQPNFFLRDLSADALTQVSEFPHPHPQMTGIEKELIRYERDDGVELSGTLYLPPGHEEGDGPLPVLMWAYPLEYKDSSVAGQVRESPYEFNRVSYWGPLPYLALGYAVFDDPKMPIVGEGEALPNDSFREQLVASAQAAVDVLVERGVAEPGQVVIGGHSYGAFMVANLLAHSDLFAAGIARSGAYNRSLTPFGFQGEERDFWEAQEVYATVSPFFHAEKIDEPILMIHGTEDNNSGTYPMQSERLFDALKGLGGKARLVMLPHESHGYRARASLLHMLWEQQQWLEAHLGD